MNHIKEIDYLKSMGGLAANKFMMDHGISYGGKNSPLIDRLARLDLEIKTIKGIQVDQC